MNIRVKVPENTTFRKTRLGALCDQLRFTGYAHVPSQLISGESTTADRADLLSACRVMPNDPYVNEGAANPRSLGQFVVFPWGDVIALPGFELPHSNGKFVAPFAIGEANPLAPNNRMFPVPSKRIRNNPAVLEMVRSAASMDPVASAGAKKMPFICQVFFQGSEVNSQYPNAPAAPPPFAHKDKCRFKLVVLIGRHNVTGGESAILPVDRLGQRSTEGALLDIDLREQGEGYAFLDETPKAHESRQDNCHVAVDLALGNECGSGYRYVATLTTAPLIIGRGDASEIDASMEHSRSVAWSWIHGSDMLNSKTAAEVAEWLKAIAR